MANFIKLTSMTLTFTIWLTVPFPEAFGERWLYRKSCRCNYSEIFNELPYFLQDLRQNENFSSIFQGERGFDGPEGPIGLPGPSGRDGPKGQKGERGLPGTSLVFNPKGSFFGSEHGEKGSMGARGPPGRKGAKGEPGTIFTTVLKDGSYIQVKGEKGDRGSRGRRGQKGEMGDSGLPGKHGLSIEGEKGQKGEPGVLPDFALLRGLPGPRGPPGRGCREVYGAKDGNDKASGFPPIVYQRKGEPGSPGLSITGPKGNKGETGPPGPPVRIPRNLVRSYLFGSEKEMIRQNHLVAGSIAFVTTNDQAYIKLSTGWKQIMLGSLSLGSNGSKNVESPDPTLTNNVHYSFEDEEDQYSKRKFLIKREQN